MNNKVYDLAIVGGGLAGLSCAIKTAQKGFSVAVFEKETYPFHKVCGEYVSQESRGYLEKLGLPLGEMSLPVINTLFLTAPNGRSFTTSLKQGGFGISRYVLEEKLAALARKNGVDLYENTKVDKVEFYNDFTIHSRMQPITARVCCAAYGKHGNLDIKWKRTFLDAFDKRLDNFVAVKYHVRTEWPHHVIGLHNFSNGYCGISKIEEDKYCLCYMTKASELKKNGNQIGLLEKNVLCKNPHLGKIFESSEIMEEFPITISQINFNKKTRVERHVLMLGDTAGLIAPLSGNGMSIALHTGKISSEVMFGFLENRMSREAMEMAYEKEWEKQFSSRLRTGRILQRFFGDSTVSNLFVQTFKTFPFLAGPMIKMTHGKPF